MYKNHVMFSVIVPVYNVKDYLSDCLESLLNQTFDDFNVIIVDDASNDGSLEIARDYACQYPTKFHILAHTDNQGPGAARNDGIQIADGEYLMFLDCDDYLKPSTMEEIAKLIERENSDIVEFCFDYVDESGGYLRHSTCANLVYAQDGTPLPLLTSTASACNKAIRAVLFQRGAISFPSLRYGEDFCVTAKLILGTSRVSYLNKPLYCYRQRSNSAIHDTDMCKTSEIMLVMDSILQYFHQEEFPPERIDEICYLAIWHVLYNGTLRANGIDRRSPMQKKLKTYMTETFPNYKSNPYLCLLSRKEKRLLSLIEHEKYGLLYLCYHVRNRFTGAIKQLLRKISGEKVLRKLQST